jgi:hypothetical protein
MLFCEEGGPFSRTGRSPIMRNNAVFQTARRLGIVTQVAIGTRAVKQQGSQRAGLAHCLACSVHVLDVLFPVARTGRS